MAVGKPPKLKAKALSFQAPAWYDILYGGKDIENRTWPTNYRGVIYIHAAKTWLPGEWHFETKDDAAYVNRMAGHIVGTVEIIDCVRTHPSEWKQQGYWGFVLARPKVLKTPWKQRGYPNLFEIDIP
jgi:hypothetical protein